MTMGNLVVSSVLEVFLKSVEWSVIPEDSIVYNNHCEMLKSCRGMCMYVT